MAGADNRGPSRGQFVDSPVAGLSYKTPTRSGVTDADGRFEYRAGENVEFSLGNTVLGEADGKARITPFDLVSLDTVPVGMREIGRALWRDPNRALIRVVNITIFLQTLDRDGDPANGIEITPAVAALFDNVSVDLTGDFWLFYQQPAFRGALLQANNAL